MYCKCTEFSNTVTDRQQTSKTAYKKPTYQAVVSAVGAGMGKLSLGQTEAGG
jgi:hypothetical protein